MIQGTLILGNVHKKKGIKGITTMSHAIHNFHRTIVYYSILQ
jgi:hypothetical protein